MSESGKNLKGKSDKVGRPTKYKDRYCKDMVKFFDVEATKIVLDLSKNDGTEFEKRVANKMPTFSGFARKIGVDQDTLHEWKKKYPEFSEAFKEAKQLQEQYLLDVGMAGVTSASFVIFTMKNVLGWRDEKDLKLKAEKENRKLTDEELNEAIFG